MAFLKEQVGALWQKPADNSKSHPLEPEHPLELDQKYTDEPKPKFTDQETRNIDEPYPKFTDQDQPLVNVPTENRFSVLQEPDSRHREVSSQKINPPQNKSKRISYHQRKSTGRVFMRLKWKIFGSEDDVSTKPRSSLFLVPKY